MRRLRSLLLTALLAFSQHAPSLADTVWNKQGTAIEGEVVEDEQGEPLLFRCNHKGVWRTFAIPRDSILKYTRTAGDQSDGGHERSDEHTASNDEGDGPNGEVPNPPAPSKEGREGIFNCNELLPLIEKATPGVNPNRREVVILHLNGLFWPANIYDVGSTISYGVVNVLMDYAISRNPQAVVLQIDSGGGRVDQMDLIIEKLLEVQQPPHSTRVVAWVRMGGSAAALTALACREIVMMPQGRLGAATKTFEDGEAVGEPENALEQKREAMREARRRQIASLTGRPIAIQHAMEQPEHQFWHHPLLGFSLEEQDADEWEVYDRDDEKPLALEAQALVDVGIATGIANDTTSLLALLHVPVDTPVVDVNLASPEFQALLEPARKHAQVGNAALEDFKKRLKKEIDDIELAIRAASGILTADEGYTLNDLRAFRTAIAKCNGPTLDKKTRDFVSATDSERLEFYEEKLETARRVLDRARQSTKDASRSGGIAIGAIVKDLRFAAQTLVDVVIYPLQ